jgi:hypothetical protein
MFRNSKYVSKNVYGMDFPVQIIWYFKYIFKTTSKYRRYIKNIKFLGLFIAQLKTKVVRRITYYILCTVRMNHKSGHGVFTLELIIIIIIIKRVRAYVTFYTYKMYSN